MSRSDLSQPIADLLAAAVAYDEVKLELELHEGPASGAIYALKLGRWRGATAELANAARAYATSKRAPLEQKTEAEKCA